MRIVPIMDAISVVQLILTDNANFACAYCMF